MKAVIYARVSTANQETQRQINDLTDFANKNNYEVVKVYQEKISGTSKIAHRKEVNELINFIDSEKIKMILVSEISRLGRSAFDIQNLLNQLSEKNINVYFQNYNSFLLDENGNLSLLTKIFTDLTANFAEMERANLSERTRAGLREAVRKGKILGRPKGKETPEQFLKKYTEVVKCLKLGLSIRKTARAGQTSIQTVQKVKKVMNQLNMI